MTLYSSIVSEPKSGDLIKDTADAMEKYYNDKIARIGSPEIAACGSSKIDIYPHLSTIQSSRDILDELLAHPHHTISESISRAQKDAFISSKFTPPTTIEIFQDYLEELQLRQSIVFRKFQSLSLLRSNLYYFYAFQSSILQEITTTQNMIFLADQPASLLPALKDLLFISLSRLQIRSFLIIFHNISIFRRYQLIESSLNLAFEYFHSSQKRIEPLKTSPPNVLSEIGRISSKLGLKADLEFQNGMHFYFICDQLFTEFLSSKPPVLQSELIPPPEPITLDEIIDKSKKTKVDERVSNYIYSILNRDTGSCKESVLRTSSSISPRWGESRNRAVCLVKLQTIFSAKLIDRIIGYLMKFEEIMIKAGARPRKDFVICQFSEVIAQVSEASSALAQTEASWSVARTLELEDEFLSDELRILECLNVISDHTDSDITALFSQFAFRLPSLFVNLENDPIGELELDVEEAKTFADFLEFTVNTLIISLEENEAACDSQIFQLCDEDCKAYKVYPSLSEFIEVFEGSDSIVAELCASCGFNWKKFSIYVKISLWKALFAESKKMEFITIGEKPPFGISSSSTAKLSTFSSLEALFNATEQKSILLSVVPGELDLLLSLYESSLLLPMYNSLSHSNQIEIPELPDFLAFGFDESSFSDFISRRRMFNKSLKSFIRGFFVYSDMNFLVNFMKPNQSSMFLTEASPTSDYGSFSNAYFSSAPTYANTDFSQYYSDSDFFNPEVFYTSSLRSELSFLCRSELLYVDGISLPQPITLSPEGYSFPDSHHIYSPLDCFALPSESLEDLLALVKARTALIGVAQFRFVLSEAHSTLIQRLSTGKLQTDPSSFSNINFTRPIKEVAYDILNEVAKSENEVTMTLLSLIFRTFSDKWKHIFFFWAAKSEFNINTFLTMLLLTSDDEFTTFAETYDSIRKLSESNDGGSAVEKSISFLLCIFHLSAFLSGTEPIKDFDASSLRLAQSELPYLVNPQCFYDIQRLEDIQGKVLGCIDIKYKKAIETECTRFETSFYSLCSAPESILKPEIYSKKKGKIRKNFFLQTAEIDSQFQIETQFAIYRAIHSILREFQISDGLCSAKTEDIRYILSKITDAILSFPCQNLSRTWENYIDHAILSSDEENEKLKSANLYSSFLQDQVEAARDFSIIDNDSKDFLRKCHLERERSDRNSEESHFVKSYTKECTSEFEKLVSDLNEEIKKTQMRFSESHRAIFDLAQNVIAFSGPREAEPRQKKAEKIVAQVQELENTRLKLRVFGALADYTVKTMYSKRISKALEEKFSLCSSLWQSRIDFEQSTHNIESEINDGHRKLAEFESELEQLRLKKSGIELSNEKNSHVNQILFRSEEKSMKALDQSHGEDIVDVKALVGRLERAKIELYGLQNETEAMEIETERKVREPIMKLDKLSRRARAPLIKADERTNNAKMINKQLKRENVELKERITEMERIAKTALKAPIERLPRLNISAEKTALRYKSSRRR